MIRLLDLPEVMYMIRGPCRNVVLVVLVNLVRSGVLHLFIVSPNAGTTSPFYATREFLSCIAALKVGAV